MKPSKHNSKFLYIFSALAVLLFAAEVFGPSGGKVYEGWQKIKGIYLLIGFIGGLLLMAAAKLLGKFWLYRKEDDHG